MSRVRRKLSQGRECSYASPAFLWVARWAWKAIWFHVNPKNWAKTYLTTLFRTQILWLQTKAWVGGLKQIISKGLKVNQRIRERAAGKLWKQGFHQGTYPCDGCRGDRIQWVTSCQASVTRSDILLRRVVSVYTVLPLLIVTRAFYSQQPRRQVGYLIGL